MKPNLIKVGYNGMPQKTAISYINKQDKSTEQDEILKPIYFDGDSHMITIAPTGSGKSVCSIIPSLLSYEGPVIVLDPKAELLNITMRTRKEKGNKVVILDPFNITDFESDTLNPFDIKKLDNFMPDTDSLTIADSLANISTPSRDPFWDRSAKSIISGLIHHAFLEVDFPDRSITGIRDFVSGEMDYSLAVFLDCHEKKLPKSVTNAYTSFLNAPSKETRPSIQVTASSYFESFYSEAIEHFFSTSSFDIVDIAKGKPVDVYIVFPPDKLKSHNHILKLIVSTLFKAILSRQYPPEAKTLVILDECASLGHFSLLETMVSLCRGYGVILHTIWQDLSQLKGNYKDTYDSFLNNAGLWQFFGDFKYHQATEISKLTGIPVNQIMKLNSDEQIIYNGSKLYPNAKRLNYLEDEEYQGMYDPNPYYTTRKKRR